MYFINIYSTFCALLLPYAATNVLTIHEWSFNMMHFFAHSPNQSPNYFEYFYTYKYSKNNKEPSFFRCVANKTLKDPRMKWQISRPKDKSADKNTMSLCQEERRSELNYVTVLGKEQNGNNLKCILKTEAPNLWAIATVLFSCTDCEETNDGNRLLANCHDNSGGISTYVNGEFSSKIERVEEFRVGSNLTVHCVADEEENVGVEFEGTELIASENVRFNRPSGSVAILQVNKNEDLDRKDIVCLRKQSTGTTLNRIKIHFKLISNFFVKVSQTDRQPWMACRKSNELWYNINDTINLICENRSGAKFNMKWCKNGQIIKNASNDMSSEVSYGAVLTEEDDNSNLTCQMMIGVKMKDARALLLRQIRPVTETTPGENDGTGTTTGNLVFEDERSTDRGGFPRELIVYLVIGIIVGFVLAFIIIFIGFKKCLRAKSTTNESTNLSFQNPNTYGSEPTRPELDPTYSGPVDDLNVYSYTTPQQLPQTTYSTPFVPTLEEMYTKPTPKTLRLIPNPGKPQYTNLNSRANQPDPGYSNLDAGDTGSETYTYCSVPGYSRPQ